MANVANRRLRVLYLGNQSPPGWAGRYVHMHRYCGEAVIWQKMSQWADVSAVTLLKRCYWDHRFDPKDDIPGLDHELVLWDRNPALWHRWDSWRKLRRYYLGKVRRGEGPDVIVVCCLQHVYNHFVKWLLRQPDRPLIVLQLADSGGLGEKVPLSRRLRYLFKPMQMLEPQAVLMYEDGCILSSTTSGRYFEPRGVPTVWHPATYKFEYDPPPPSPNQTGPINFGYFGALSSTYAITSVVRGFLKAKVPGKLYMCGKGDSTDELAELARLHPNFIYDGFLPKESDCLDWAQKADVLINSRFPIRGQDNSFPSKVLEYGIAGKAILSTRTSGVDVALGDEGYYLETDNLEHSVAEKVREISAVDRAELQRRARIFRDRVLKEYNPEAQARCMFDFLDGLVKKRELPKAHAKPELSASAK
jgi:glycosyltransferase involved in cell wall biosynthesis